MDTVSWLNESLIRMNDNTIIHRVGRQWEQVAGFSRVGCIFGIYKDTNGYCAHAGDEWKENEEPLFGYYDIKLSWDELISMIANKYDSLRKH